MLGVSKHDVLVDRHHATPFAGLHHLGRAQLLVGHTPGMGVRAPCATPWRLVPFSIHMQQGSAVFRQVITGKKGDEVCGDRRDPRQQLIGFSWRARADDNGHDQAPLWSKGHPDPGIAIGVTISFRPRERLVFRLDNTPPLVQLTRAEGQLWPPIQGHKSTLLGGAIEPGTHGILIHLIHLDDPRGRPDRMALRQGANGQFKQGRVMLHIDIRGSVGQGDAPPTRATQGLALAPCGPILDQPAVAKAYAVKQTVQIWTISGFPVHVILGFPSDLGSAEETVFGDA